MQRKELRRQILLGRIETKIVEVDLAKAPIKEERIQQEILAEKSCYGQEQLY